MKQKDTEQVRDEKPAFPWLVTPNFFFCFLLLLCMFVPGFQSCSDKTIYIGEGLVSPFAGFTNLPQLLAIVVLIGAFLWCFRFKDFSKDAGAKFVWRSLSVLAVINFLPTGFLLCVLFFETKESSTNWNDVYFFLFVGLYVTIPAVVCLVVFFKCRSLVFKAIVMQFVMSLAGLASAMYFLPGIMLAKKFYIGGKLNIIGVFGLLFMSIVQLIDGQRSLNRRRGEPIVRLTLKQSFLLMTIGCVLCSLAVGLFVVEPPSTNSDPQVQAAEDAPA